MTCLWIYCTVLHILLVMKICNCESTKYTKSKELPNIYVRSYFPETEKSYLSPFGREQTSIYIQNNIFYDEDKEYISERRKPEILKINGVPRCAKDLTYCETIPNYPYRQLDEVLRSNFINRELFENEEPVLSFRNSDYDEEVCKSIQKSIYPMAAINIFNEWKYILNNRNGTGFKQEVEIEICKSTKQETMHDCGFKILWGYRTKCKQRYLYRPLLSFSEDGEVSHDTFKLPSACSCTYIKQPGVNNFHRKGFKGRRNRRTFMIENNK